MANHDQGLTLWGRPAGEFDLRRLNPHDTGVNIETVSDLGGIDLSRSLPQAVEHAPTADSGIRLEAQAE